MAAPVEPSPTPAVASSVSGELLSSLELNVGISVAGLTVWLVARAAQASLRSRLPSGETSFPLLGRERTQAWRSGSASVCNYLLYLRASACMCAAMTIVKLLVLLPLPNGLYRAILTGENIAVLYLFDNKGGAGNMVLLGLAFGVLDGCIALAFIYFIAGMAQPRVLDEATREKTGRTAWLMKLPKRNTQTRKAFRLSDADVEQVEMDIVKAIDDQLLGPRTPDRESTVEACHVALVLDTWHHVQSDLAVTKDYIMSREGSLRELEEAGQPACCCIAVRRAALQFYLRWRLGRLRRRQERLSTQLQAIRSGPKQLSGSAFVTFRRREYRDRMLQESLPCWKCRRHTFFSFGRPPFASVTLRCRRAPVPGDIEWLNLHVGNLKHWLALVLATLLLFLLMFVLVTPTSLVVTGGTLIEGLSHNVKYVRHHTDDLAFLSKATRTEIAEWLDVLDHAVGLEQMPTMMLLLINSLVLPCAIEGIGGLERASLKAWFEHHQKYLHYVFLLLNTVVFPFIGVTTLSAAVEWAPRNVEDLITTARLHVAHASVGLFGLKYLLNATFISSTIALLDASQATVKAVLRRLLLTQREREETLKPWPFAWGYWYAWTLSIYALTMITCTIIPAMLPLASAFFFLRYLVDGHNLNNGVYAAQTDAEGWLALSAVRDMRTIVGACWALLGLGGIFAEHALWACGLPLEESERLWLWASGAVLLLAALALQAWAQWSYQQQKHLTLFIGSQPPALPPILQRLAPVLGRRNSLPQEPARSAEEPEEAEPEVHWDGKVLLGLR